MQAEGQGINLRNILNIAKYGDGVWKCKLDHPDLCGTGAPRCVLKIFDEDIGVMSWMPQVFC